MRTEINMTYKKSTKGTHVYESADKDAPCRTIYVRRAGWPHPTPEEIRLTIEVLD